ncbi:MAG TPA: hypothetical protein VGQ91_13990 [Ideonella sp.]|jgi:hypothetical protein|nr:hypothetical protein [Ideonella sp.]
MSNAAHPSLLRRLMGLPAPIPELDPADMGTAIGLDFCLDEPPPVAPATPPGLASPAQTMWLRRLRAN